MKTFYLTLILCTCLTFQVFAQNRSVSGTVKDQTGEALVGVTVALKGSTQGTVTDIDGKFIINNIPEGPGTLIFSFVGFITQEIPIEASNEFNIILQSDVSVLDELVVVGYGVQKKSNITGSIAQVKSEDLEDMQIGRIEQALQGRASGIRITQNSGQPGAASVVRVRGTSSINGTEPLYVVDGVVIGGGIDYLNPGDIESIEVLKDAASAAIYGSRGANGVILVTTKSGKAGAAKINYNAYYGWQNPWKKLPVLNGYEYAVLRNEMAAAAGQNLPFADPSIYGEGTDWQDQVFNDNAAIQNHEINFSGGNQKSTYYASLGYFDQEGIVAPGRSDYSRISARLNMQNKLVNDRVRIGLNLGYTHNESRGVATNTEFGSPLGRALNIDPLTPLYETDPDVLSSSPYSVGGETRPNLVRGPGGIYGISPFVTSEIVNPVAALAIDNGRGWADKIVSNAYIEVEVIKNLKVRSSFGVDLAIFGGEGFTPAHYLNATNRLDTNFVSQNITRSYTWLWDKTISYDFNIQSDHQFSALVGHSAQSTNGRYIGGSKNDVPGQDPDQATIDFARNEASEQVFGGKFERYTIESFFGRLNYSYKDKYLLTAIMRADASSRFGRNFRWGYFPSVSVGWNISEEDFFQGIDFINNLKLRAGWGRNGNDTAGSLEYIGTISGGRNYTFGSDERLINGTSPSQVANPDLRWETAEQLDLGFDVRFLNNFSLSFDYYIQNTFDMKAPATIPDYIGNVAGNINVGDMRNTGVDLELGYATGGKDWDLAFNGNISYVKNTVRKISNDITILPGQTWGPQGLEITRTQEGLPIGYFFGFVTDGIFQNEGEISTYTGPSGAPIQPNAVPGDFRYVDVNGDGVINADDRTNIGDPTPSWTYGLTINAEYKNFDLVIFGQGVFGNEVFNATQRYDLPTANLRASAIGRWTGEGTTNSYPRLTLDDTNANFARSSDFYVENGAFFRLKTLQLGYTIPKDISSKARISKARIYFAANNLFTITQYSGFDPEIGVGFGVDRGIYPQARMYSLGINVSFE